VAFSLFALLFAVWWNYAALVMAYVSLPRYKAEVRQWWWERFGDPFASQTRRIAGSNPLQCSIDADLDVGLSACKAKALQQHRGFYLRSSYGGIDSWGASGIIGNTDAVAYEVTFDVWGNYVKVWRRRCPTPLQFVRVDALSGYTIHCIPVATSEKDLEIIQDDWAERFGRANHTDDHKLFR
jgi:hypothetical protein